MLDPERIKDIVQSSGEYFELSATHIIIRCPYHSEKTPSCNINLGIKDEPGLFHCFGCKKGGNWNMIARKMGWPLDYNSANDPNFTPETENVADIRRKLIEIERDNEEIEDWESYHRDLRGAIYLDPVNWRGITAEVLKLQSVKRATFGKASAKAGKRGQREPCMLFPVRVGGDEAGVLKTERKKNRLIYKKSPGDWSHTRGIYGYDVAFDSPEYKNNGVVFIVEGPRDCLRLTQAGVPSVSVLGSHQWNELKQSLIVDADPKKIVVMFDGDEAGYEGADEICDMLNGNAQFDRINLPIDERKLDPGNLSIASLQKYYQRFV